MGCGCDGFSVCRPILGDAFSGYFLRGITMNTDYAKEKLAEYEKARAALSAPFEFGGAEPGGASYANATGCFATLTRYLVEEVDRLQARTDQ